MLENTDRRQSWFNRIAIVICIGIVVALLLPSIQQVNSGQRSYCQNHIKNIALATVNFETTKRCYPGYQAEFGGRSGTPVKIGSWVVSLLPYLDQQELRDVWDDPAEQSNWVKAVTQADANQLKRFYPELAVFICPQDKTIKGNSAPLSYGANTGFYLMPSDPAFGMAAYSNATDDSARSSVSQRVENGVFANGLPTQVVDPKVGTLISVFGPSLKKYTSEDIRDGCSQTIAFFECNNNLSWRDYSIDDDSARLKLGCIWLYAGEASTGRPTAALVTANMRINFKRDVFGTAPARARPNSFHTGIVSAAMLDGSVKNIDEGIDYKVYQALMTPQTRESDVPNIGFLLREQDYLQ